VESESGPPGQAAADDRLTPPRHAHHLAPSISNPKPRPDIDNNNYNCTSSLNQQHQPHQQLTASIASLPSATMEATTRLLLPASRIGGVIGKCVSVVMQMRETECVGVSVSVGGWVVQVGRGDGTTNNDKQSLKRDARIKCVLINVNIHTYTPLPTRTCVQCPPQPHPQNNPTQTNQTRNQARAGRWSRASGS
jgi:hypothetical protein